MPATDGASVVDPLRKLVWDRCVHGQRWSGQTCAGAAEPLSHAEGAALAAELSEATLSVVPGNHMSAVIKPDLGQAMVDFLGFNQVVS